MRHVLIASLAAAGLMITACSPAERADTKADLDAAGDKIAAETKEAAADVKGMASSPEAKEAGAEIKQAAKDVGAMAKDAAGDVARETKEAVHDATAPSEADKAREAADAKK
jgi:hypothetical protein